MKSVHSSEGGDRRISKTRKAIKHSLAKIMREKRSDKISVSELSEIADISRRTFYLHYSSVENVLEEIESDLCSGYYNLQVKYHDNGEYDLKGVFQALFRCINNDLSYYKDLAHAKESSELYTRIVSAFRNIRLDFITGSEGESSNMFFIQTFLNNGAIATIYEWLHSDSQASAQEIYKIVQTICSSCHKDFNF